MRLSRITVSIHRADLVSEGACAEGLTDFDSLATGGVWAFDFSPTFSVLFATSAFKRHTVWLVDRGFLPRANLGGANLGGANLCGADLYGADLYGANLCGADLCGADLCGANLGGANLCGANFCGADLYGADLCGADLCGADRPSWLPSKWIVTASGFIARRT